VTLTPAAKKNRKPWRAINKVKSPSLVNVSKQFIDQKTRKKKEEQQIWRGESSSKRRE